MATATYRIRGMDCVEEVSAIRNELFALPGIQDLAFDVVNAKVTVRYAEDSVSLPEIVAAVGRTALKAELWRESHEAEDAAAKRHHRIRSALRLLNGKRS